MVEQLLQSLSRFLPETTLTAAICITVVVSLFLGRKSQATIFIALVGLALATWFSFDQMGVSETIFSGMVAVDPFSVFFKLVVGLSAILILLFSLYSSEVQSTLHRAGEYSALILAMALGMFLMAGASNLLMMVLAIELTSLSSYILAGYTREA